MTARKYVRVTNDPLKIELNPDGKQWTLLQDMHYHVGAPDSQDVIVVPKGQTTDLASVPWFARWFVGTWQGTAKAAMVHDYLYRSKGDNGRFTKKESDKIFLEVLQVVDALPTYKQLIAWAAVSFLGKGKF
jgi:hypothetical protein|tara:strand:- start:8955 stop:9347 length:393 start_codon:yes stop_codon:yes gene_type:complete